MIIKQKFCLFLHKNLCCRCSLKSHWRGDSNEHPQHRFYEDLTKIIFQLLSNTHLISSSAPYMKIEYDYPHSNVLFNFYTSKIHYFAPKESFISNLKPICCPSTSNLTVDYGFQKDILQNILLHILDVVQSDIALHSQMH